MRLHPANPLPSTSLPYLALNGECDRTERRGNKVRPFMLMTEWVALLSVVKWAVSVLPERYSLSHNLGFVEAVGSTLASWLVWHLLQLRSEREQVRLQLREANERTGLLRALLDMGTSLPNRAGVETKLQNAIDSSVPMGCLSVDLGGRHQDASDKVAAAVAQVLLPALAPTDMLGRIRPGRFAVLTQRPLHRDQLAAFAERLVFTLSEPIAVDGCSIRLTPRVGIAVTPGDGASGDCVLSASGFAVEAARSGCGSPFRFAADLPSGNSNRTQWLAEKLENAIESGLLRLVYQPIFDASNRMIAVEALTRWNDPEAGCVSPAEFIEVAEHTGLIVPLSHWVMSQACRQMVQWRAQGGPIERVAVNISAHYAGQSDFPATVQNLLVKTRLAPHCLELELTESALASDFEKIRLNLQALSESGVRISIDDFGTGYSSLSRVRDLRADVLKIDRSFVHAATDQRSRAAVVKAIVEMAHTLNLTVIAEGVETYEQLKMLRDMRCDELQGFLLGRPQTAAEITALLGSALPLAQRCTGHDLHLMSRVA